MRDLQSPSASDSSAALTALAASAGGWVVFERDGDICAGALENESERRVRIVRAEGGFKILKNRVWALFSVAPNSETDADALVAKAQNAARGKPTPTRCGRPCKIRAPLRRMTFPNISPPVTPSRIRILRGCGRFRRRCRIRRIFAARGTAGLFPRRRRRWKRRGIR